MAGVVETTTYRVELLYDIKGQPESKLDAIAKHAKHASESTELLRKGLEVLGVGIGIESAKKHFIDFNKEVENAKISLSAMLQGNYGVRWDQAVKGADDLYTEFQRFSQLTPVTTQEMLEFGRGVAVATAQAGGSIKDITNITEQGVVAAKALGAQSSYASLELTEMLQGNVSRRMRFAQQLLGMAHMDEKEFKALSAEKRLQTVEKVLNSDAMKNATTAFSTSFSGVVSTLEDKLQILLGRVGLPLFKAITNEVVRWNEWIDKNSAKVDHIVASVGHGLVEGFRYVKSVAEFLWEHSDALIMIAKAWAAVKIGQTIGGMLNLGGIAGMFKTGGLEVGLGSAKGLGNLAGNAGNILGVGLASYALTTAFMDATGASKALADAINPLGARIDSVVRSMDMFDESVNAAAANAKNAFGQLGGRVQGTIDYERMQVAALQRINAGNYTGAKSFAWRATQRAELEKSGFDSDEIDKLLGNRGAREAEIARRQRRVTDVSSKGAVAETFTSIGLAYSMAKMDKTQQAALDVAKATQLILQKQLELIHSGHLVMSPEQVAEFLKEHKEEVTDPFKAHAAFNQNITNNIQVEVAAKDPDRWIQELDAKVQRKVRAPSQPRGAMVFKGGSM